MGRYNLYIPASTKYLLRRASKRLHTNQMDLARKIAEGKVDFDDIYTWGLDLRDRERIRFLYETEKEFAFKAVFPVRTENPNEVRSSILAVSEMVRRIVEKFYQNHEDLYEAIGSVHTAIWRIQHTDGLTEWDRKHLARHVEEIQKLLRGDEQ
ncbi:hypothetical protein FH039_11145 [Thermococcus indicus]|uniref:Uncharacterized protein n=1 Tax=Thermococcus indicus TaxID=2586643 RepID=A0A4Y5SP64_9EURY|nr:hypothetical protein [Thermococcus indicus]QDA32049.1 hypothetical protein FH039_11145 [Thermococcus indicus]